MKPITSRRAFAMQYLHTRQCRARAMASGFFAWAHALHMEVKAIRRTWRTISRS
jgi:hypothetical protein